MEKKDNQCKEIEKPFRCNVCTLGFTNEDHLQVHKRRHEMSLNLNKLASGGSANETYMDETPTPTRFIKNCEEVGLFQDLQNVNPFDEQFVKAAVSATPTETGFDFSFNYRNSITLPDSSNSNETLNTPQVFGFMPGTPVVIQRQSQKPLESRKEWETSQKIISVKSQEPQLQKGDQIAETSGFIKKTSPKRSKSNLTLNLSPAITVNDSEQYSSGNSACSTNTPTSQTEAKSCKGKSVDNDGNERKAGILERNRAAASRSRQRRKQYISALELKCSTLQTKLSQVQAELAKTKAENINLKQQLELQNNCDVKDNKNIISASRVSTPIISSSIAMSRLTPPFKPSILRQNSQKSPQSISNVILLSPLPQEVITHVNCLQGPDLAAITSKSKRGRPRKGLEKRVSQLSLIPNSSSEPPQKIKILSISAYNKTINQNQNINLEAKTIIQ